VNLRFSLHIGLAFFVDGPTISYLISAAADVNEQLDIPITRKGGLVVCWLGLQDWTDSKFGVYLRTTVAPSFRVQKEKMGFVFLRKIYRNM